MKAEPFSAIGRHIILVYSFEYGAIVNIDLEGFLTYNPVPKWANLEVCETWLKDVISQLNGLISSEE